MTSVERKTSEPTGTGTPDEIETDIIRIVSAVPELAQAEAWRSGDAPWTVHISRALAKLGKDRRFEVCAKHCKGIADHGEWLFDHVWIDGERVPLVLESEWGDEDKVDRDFHKIRLARADHRVMIFQVWHGDRVKVMPADSFVAPKTTAGFDTYASEAVSLFRRRGNTPVGLLKRPLATFRTDSSSGPA